ncbi:MAG TPA: hypothetical protein VK211_10080 [Kamptonema sp.]|nr:hypothetical protein [Kamptonema sp.]
MTTNINRKKAEVLEFLKPKMPPLVLSFLEKNLCYSEAGNYFYLPILSIPPCEALFCIWLPASNWRKHSHYESQALVVPLSGTINHTVYHVSADTFFTLKTEDINPWELKFIPPWAIHSCRNLSNGIAVSFHFYYPRRRNIQLEIADH